MPPSGRCRPMPQAKLGFGRPPGRLGARHRRYTSLFAMPYASRKHVKRLDPRGPLVFDTRALRPGSVRTEDRTVPAPAGLGVELVRIPEGADLQLHVQLEGVAEGTLVTATVSAPLTGECARCLGPVTSATQVRLQELFAYEAPAEAPDADGYLQDGDLLDLEPALRDALVLELPLAPRSVEGHRARARELPAVP